MTDEWWGWNSNYGTLDPMLVLLYAIPVATLVALITCHFYFENELSFGWWVKRISVLPWIFSTAAIYIHLNPVEVLDWNPITDPNYGRMDFVAIMFWGIFLPLAYQAVAIPACLRIVFTKRKK
ncbi:hypothetical protein [Altererythrobacter sp. GH1-8]|uniref:hypothetical protein n=1 Tax=Altererythrobacter sp. GH1-8 TaxID=3349333 RepID=UPI00374CB1A3